MLCHVSGFHEGESPDPTLLFFVSCCWGRPLAALPFCLSRGDAPEEGGGAHRVVRRAGVRHPFAVSFFFSRSKKSGQRGGRWIAWGCVCDRGGENPAPCLGRLAQDPRLSYGPARRRRALSCVGDGRDAKPAGPCAGHSE